MSKNPDRNILKGIKREITDPFDALDIMAVADLHIGDKNCDYNEVKDIINKIATTDNLYCVLAGDLMNTAIAGCRSDVYGEELNPSEQLEKCVELFNPIKDKILAIVPGNHEERISRSVGFDMTAEFAKRLELGDIYSPTAALIFVKFGRATKTCAPLTYSFYVTHGRGGGRKIGGKLNSLSEYASVIDVDCYIVGHTHLPAAFKQSSYRVTPQRAQATLHEQLFVNTSAALNYGGYGMRSGYTPAAKSRPIITLDGTKQHLSVTL